MEYLQYLFGEDGAVSLEVLNLIINGIPSIQLSEVKIMKELDQVLNLIINGIPSILLEYYFLLLYHQEF